MFVRLFSIWFYLFGTWRNSHLHETVHFWNHLNRKYVVFGKLVQGHEVLKRIESVGDEEGIPTATVKIIYCGEIPEGKIHRSAYWRVVFTVLTWNNVQDFAIGGLVWFLRCGFLFLIFECLFWILPCGFFCFHHGLMNCSMSYCSLCLIVFIVVIIILMVYKRTS